MKIDSVIKLLRQRCEHEGGIRAFSRHTGFTAGHISRVLRGYTVPGPQLLAALGLEVRVTVSYHQIGACNNLLHRGRPHTLGAP